MPDPRTIALQSTDKANLVPDEGYDAAAGTPAGMCKQGSLPDYAVNPTNPPTPPAPAKNLKR